MALWSDLYKLFTYAFEDDPITKQSKSRDISGAGVGVKDAIPDIRQDGSFWGGSKGIVRLRESNDFVDLSSITSRISRYKEYERLLNTTEINSALTVISDETCVAGSTRISTPFYGEKTIKWLEENKKDERFLVYCWDFEQNDFTLGWAYDPRIVKKSETIKIKLDDGTYFIATPDHRVLLKDLTWTTVGELKYNDELLAFYRVPPNTDLNNLKSQLYPRIYTHQDGWKNERQFIDEWRLGKKDESLERVQKVIRMISSGLNCRETAKLAGHEWKLIDIWIKKQGFKYKELRWLGNKKPSRKIIGISPYKEIDVYDLSVEKHENFCTDSVVLHNCQKGKNNHILEIEVKNPDIKKELDWLFFSRKMLNIDSKGWGLMKNLGMNGDLFLEIVINPENPKDGIIKVAELPAESMFRIETIKGRLLEFQQSKEGPDIQALTRNEVTKATQAEINQSTAIRFTPDQIVHFRIMENRKMFYPYGVSLIEPARGPAHQLRLMEDSMVIYRLTRAPERRVFYIDTQMIAPHKVEAFMDRIKDVFRKKKVSTSRGSLGGAEGIEERWHSQPVDEDIWIPTRPNANSRVDTLPGAQNLGEIDDSLYFRDKVYRALNFPKDYFNSDDPNKTRMTLSSQDMRFGKFIERLQSYMEEGFYQIAERHLQLLGYPEELYEDLSIKMTPPCPGAELSEQEIIAARISNATQLKGVQLLADFDILTKWLKYTEEEAEEIIARNKIQQLEQARLQIIMSNPQLAGVGSPADNETEMGAEAGGPNPMLNPPEQGENPNPEEEQTPPPEQGQGQEPKERKGPTLPEPSSEDIAKYDLEIQNYELDQDREDIDFSLGIR